MPSAKKIRQTMLDQEIPEGIMDQFDFSDPKGNQPEPIIKLINQMDTLLSGDQCLSIMERQGCCKGGQRDRDCKAFANEHAGKSVNEKLSLLAGIDNMCAPRLDDDGTISVILCGYQNGVHKGDTTCSCGTVKKLKQPFSVSPTYCGCCAGHFLYHYQNALGVKLRLRDIVSSPLNTNGEKPCEFNFEIVSK